jgi:hypothetical protein
MRVDLVVILYPLWQLCFPSAIPLLSGCFTSKAGSNWSSALPATTAPSQMSFPQVQHPVGVDTVYAGYGGNGGSPELGFLQKCPFFLRSPTPVTLDRGNDLNHTHFGFVFGIRRTTSPTPVTYNQRKECPIKTVASS